MKLLLLVSFLLWGCGTLPEQYEPRYIPRRDKCSLRLLANKHDVAFSPYLATFVLDARHYNVSCIYTDVMQFESDMKEEWAGYCTPIQKIAINTSFWKYASETERRTLIYHELGHCALGLDHRTDRVDIMNPAVLHPEVARSRWEGLVKNLFDDARAIPWK